MCFQIRFNILRCWELRPQHLIAGGQGAAQFNLLHCLSTLSLSGSAVCSPWFLCFRLSGFPKCLVVPGILFYEWKSAQISTGRWLQFPLYLCVSISSSCFPWDFFELSLWFLQTLKCFFLSNDPTLEITSDRWLILFTAQTLTY